MFSKKDLKFLRTNGVDPKRLDQQIETIKAGKTFITAERPATIQDGIFKPNQEEIDQFVEIFNLESKKLNLSKFVPASGAATRMFKRLSYLRDNYKGSEDEFLQVSAEKDFYSLRNTFENIEKFAFYPEVFKRFFRRGQSLDKLLKKNEYDKIAGMILNKRGLNYSELPKALILFHKYPGHTRTAFEEHLVEGIMYCRSEDDDVNIHFTIQKEHQKLFEKRFKHSGKTFLKKEDAIKINLGFSEQSVSTSSIAINSKGNLLRNKNRELVLRPGGHGALIENLNNLICDIVFIKNVDNVAPDTVKHETVRYKKFLGGYLMYIRLQVFDILNKLDKSPKLTDKAWKEINQFLKKILPNTKFSDNKEKAVVELKYALNRPIRVCGMVENTSEPGGGPFWVKRKNGNLCLEILEKNQINLEDEKQLEMLEDSTHFNPVDIACSIRDYKGNKFNLLNFRDENAGLVVEKSHEGEIIKSYELPGLWNGGMSNWLTVFVEVPQITFNPVKELNDLLRVQHQTAK
jgi:hypothetical protein